MKTMFVVIMSAFTCTETVQRVQTLSLPFHEPAQNDNIGTCTLDYAITYKMLVNVIAFQCLQSRIIAF